MLLNAVAAHAFGPYTAGQSGYDISYPQCPGTSAPSGSFGIIGVNDGRPFTVNPCFGNEYSGAANSVYMNTGYARAYRSNITVGCSTGPSTAWKIGCSEAETSIKYAHAYGVESIAMWWLDVEILNKWSPDLALNRFTLQGTVTRLSQTDLPVGIYSSEPMWLMITGSMMAPGYLSAEWNAAGSCTVPFTRMTQLPVWLGQHVYSDLDHDTAC